jgi:hypothetical protein
VKLSPDDIVTMVTDAPTESQACTVVDSVRSRAALLAVADLLYVDYPEGHTDNWLRAAIVREARS